MKRFNLLLVTKEGGLREAVLQALSKTYKRNFIFELPSVEEAAHLLAKLHIDILMVDLDLPAMDLVALSKRYPGVIVMGVASNPSRVQANIDFAAHCVFEKRDVVAAFTAELKARRKPLDAPERVQNRVRNQSPAAATDFRDFFKLIKVGLS